MKTQTIEVDEATATALESCAAQRDMTVRELVAELVTLDVGADQTESGGLAELERRWNAVESGQEASVPHDDVVRWLRTWGTPAFRPWRER